MRLTWPEETVPVLRVDDADVAVAWYERLGFVREWTHRFGDDFPAFASVRRGPDGAGVRLFLSEHEGDAQPNGLVYLRVTDVRPIADAFGVDVEVGESRDEVHLADPSGNRLRIGSPNGGIEPGYR